MATHSWRFAAWKKVLSWKTNPENLVDVVQGMHRFLSGFERTTQWYGFAWHCLDILWEAVSSTHQNTLPEMICQQTGVCCKKQVPRVSMFELMHVAEAVLNMEMEEQVEISEQCHKAVASSYTNSLLGEGVPCPMLIKREQGRHACLIYKSRPLICKMTGVSTSLSWDCILWRVYKNRFPVLDKDLIRPVLKLFAYCRNVFARDYLGRKDGRQMMLLGTGLLAALGERPPMNPDLMVNASLPHQPFCAEDLWLRNMNPPPQD